MLEEISSCRTRFKYQRGTNELKIEKSDERKDQKAATAEVEVSDGLLVTQVRRNKLLC